MRTRLRGERLNDGLSVLTVGSGPDLVLVPGLGAGADLAVGVPRAMGGAAKAVALGTRRTVHLINRPVAMPSGTTIAELAGWYATGLRGRFGVPVDVMGVSGGGVTALQLAMDHPGVVRRLVVAVAASRVSERGRRDLLRGARLEREGKSAAWLSSGLVTRGFLRLAVAAAFALGTKAARAPGEVALIEAVQDWDVTARLGEIVAPTLIVTGSRDPLIPPEYARATADGIPNAGLVMLKGRGHATALFDPRSTRAIAAFLDAA